MTTRWSGVTLWCMLVTYLLSKRALPIPDYPLGWQWCSWELLHTAWEPNLDWRMVFNMDNFYKIMKFRAITLLLNKVTQSTQLLYTVSYARINNFIKMIRDILATGVTNDKRTTITLPPAMDLSWLSSMLVLTIRFSRLSIYSFALVSYF